MTRFVRFRSKLRSRGLPATLGVFHATSTLADSGRLDPWSMERAELVCSWFNEHLPVPRLGPELTRAIFWFRSDCREMIQRLWELAILLRDHGADVELVHTTRPGWVRYADEFLPPPFPQSIATQAVDRQVECRAKLSWSSGLWCAMFPTSS